MSGKIRQSCPYTNLNRTLERGCTDDHPCPQCRMDTDLEEHSELYEALEG